MLLGTSAVAKRINIKLAHRLRWSADPGYYANADSWILTLQRKVTAGVLYQ